MKLSSGGSCDAEQLKTKTLEETQNHSNAKKWPKCEVGKKERELLDLLDRWIWMTEEEWRRNRLRGIGVCGCFDRGWRPALSHNHRSKFHMLTSQSMTRVELFGNKCVSWRAADRWITTDVDNADHWINIALHHSWVNEPWLGEIAICDVWWSGDYQPSDWMVRSMA